MLTLGAEGMSPYLVDGDVVETEITGIGVLRNRCVKAKNWSDPRLRQHGVTGTAAWKSEFSVLMRPKTGMRTCAAAFADWTVRGRRSSWQPPPPSRRGSRRAMPRPTLSFIPLAMMKELADAPFVTPESITPIGSVTVGVVVRNGAREPDLLSVDAFSQSLRAADRVVYNRASRGLYVASVLERLGLKEELAATSVIVPTGAAVMERLVAESTLNAIGFGHVTEIRLHNDLGTHLVGLCRAPSAERPPMPPA